MRHPAKTSTQPLPSMFGPALIWILEGCATNQRLRWLKHQAFVRFPARADHASRALGQSSASGEDMALPTIPFIGGYLTRGR